MGIFDVFKTKVNEAAEKAGDVAGQAAKKAGDMAGQARDKVSDLADQADKKRRGDAADDPGARTSQAAAGPEAEASDMVSEGAPVAQTGEAAPGAGDSAGGGMTQTIKDNAAGGAEKAGEKIDSGMQQAEDRRR